MRLLLTRPSPGGRQPRRKRTGHRPARPPDARAEASQGGATREGLAAGRGWPSAPGGVRRGLRPWAPAARNGCHRVGGALVRTGGIALWRSPGLRPAWIARRLAVGPAVLWTRSAILHPTVGEVAAAGLSPQQREVPLALT